VQVVAVPRQFRLAPLGQVVGEVLSRSIDDAAEPVPAAARQHVAKREVRRQARQFAGEAHGTDGHRQPDAQFGDGTVQVVFLHRGGNVHHSPWSTSATTRPVADSASVVRLRQCSPDLT
jgi:hypothetical protein